MKSKDACPSDWEEAGRAPRGHLVGKGCSHPVALTFPGRNQKIREVASCGPKGG